MSIFYEKQKVLEKSKKSRHKLDMKKDPWLKRKNLYSSPIPKTVENPKIKWRILPILWMALKRTCMLFGAVTLLTIIITAWSLSDLVIEMAPKPLPSKMVLYMELDGELGDIPKDVSFTDPFSSNLNKTLKNFIDAIERAKYDPRVVGIYAKMKSGHYALSDIQEIRKAIKDFRKSGKFAYIYAPSYSNGLGGYYLAASFDEIWLQPMGSVMIAGVNLQIPFLRKTLDKIGIEPQFFKRKEYKNAYDSLINNEMSDTNREAMNALVLDIASVVEADVSVDRGFDKGVFKKLVDHGLFISSEALNAGLIDVVDYADKLAEHINKKVTGSVEGKSLVYVNFDNYIGEMISQNNNKMVNEILKNEKGDSLRIALIYLVGTIIDDKKGSGGMGSNIASADEIARTLMTIAYSDDIDGVVIRINSPGGSPVASETILRAVQKVQEKGKMVIVSMGGSAASGGYWVASAADRIFALPTTITGSIGVLGGKISMQKLWENVGVNWDGIKWGENAAIFSPNAPFSESEAQRMKAMLDNIYDSFVTRVAKGRNMNKEDVEKIARGRVWVGTSAVEVGLVDQLGGLNDAINYAAVKLGATGRGDVDVVILPKPLTPVERFIQLLEGQVIAGKVLGIFAPVLSRLQPVISEFMVMHDMQDAAIYSYINYKN